MVHCQQRQVGELALTEAPDQLVNVINKLKANVDPGDTEVAKLASPVISDQGFPLPRDYEVGTTDPSPCRNATVNWSRQMPVPSVL